MKFFIAILFLITSVSAFSGGIITRRDTLRNVYLLSVGVDLQYGHYECRYCAKDAGMIAEYIQKSPNTDSVHAYVLTSANATRDSITGAIKSIAAKIKPSDIFIFSFAGMSLEGYAEADSSTEKTILFVPFLSNPGNKANNAIDWAYIQRESLSLRTLKNLLDLVQAKRQLIFTEAGAGANFPEYLTNTFIDKDIYNAQTNDRNRIFITTQGIGQDMNTEFKYAAENNCGYTISTSVIQGGPIAYFFTHLDSIHANVLDIFNGTKTIERKLHFIEELNSCHLPRAYTNIIYERDVLKIVTSVARTLEKGSSRGGELLEDENRPVEEKATPPKMKNYALLIGTDHYKASAWKRLRNPVYDVRKIDTLLRNNYGFETELLLDTSRKAILAALKRYSKMDFDSTSQLLVFIAGHGMYDENNFGLIACSDSEDPKADADFDTYISHSRLRDNLNAIKCRHIMVVLDVCFGGTFNQSLNSMQMLNSTDATTLNNYKQNQLNDRQFALRLMGNKTRLYLTSGGKEYVPDGIPGHHSPFASGFIKALESRGGDDKLLNCGEIRSNVIRLNPEPRGGSFDPGADGDFVLIAK